MITPGSFLDKAIGDKKNEYANTDAKYSHVQDEKRNFIYKKMMVSHLDLNFTVHL